MKFTEDCKSRTSGIRDTGSGVTADDRPVHSSSVRWPAVVVVGVLDYQRSLFIVIHRAARVDSKYLSRLAFDTVRRASSARLDEATAYAGMDRCPGESASEDRCCAVSTKSFFSRRPNGSGKPLKVREDRECLPARDSGLFSSRLLWSNPARICHQESARITIKRRDTSRFRTRVAACSTLRIMPVIRALASRANRTERRFGGRVDAASRKKETLAPFRRRDGRRGARSKFPSPRLGIYGMRE